jgi:hypothetical protein
MNGGDETLMRARMNRFEQRGDTVVWPARSRIGRGCSRIERRESTRVPGVDRNWPGQAQVEQWVDRRIDVENLDSG